MEETIQNSPITPQQPKPKSQLLVFISIFLAMLISGGVVYWWQSLVIEKNNQKNQTTIDQLQQQINNLQNQLSQTQSVPTTGFDSSPTPSPGQKVGKTVDWQVHMDYSNAYSIKYPDGWGKIDFDFNSGGIGVGPGEVKEGEWDTKWSVNIYNSSATTIEEVISDIGDQFEDRNEKRENVVIWAGNIKAIKVTVTTSQYSDWYAETVIFEHYGKIFSISNGAIKDSNFELFYKSFSRMG